MTEKLNIIITRNGLEALIRGESLVAEAYVVGLEWITLPHILEIVANEMSGRTGTDVTIEYNLAANVIKSRASVWEASGSRPDWDRTPHDHDENPPGEGHE